MKFSSNSQTEARYFGTATTFLHQHRGMARPAIGRRTLVEAFLLTVGLTVAWLFVLPWVAYGWGYFLAFWNEALALNGHVRLLVDDAGLVDWVFPYLYLDAAAPGALIWWSTAVVTIIGFILTYFLPARMVPLCYFLRAVLLIQGTALVFFFVMPEAYPYTLPQYLEGLTSASLFVVTLVPLVLGLTYYILDFRLLQKVGLTLLIMGYLVMQVAFQYLLQAVLIHFGSLLFMPLLYLLFGLPLNVLSFIALYAWGMSRPGPFQHQGTTPVLEPPMSLAGGPFTEETPAAKAVGRKRLPTGKVLPILGLLLCVTGGAETVAQITIERTSTDVFYIDTSGDSLRAAYASYRVTNTGGSAYTEVWAEITGFTGGFVSLAPNETNTVKLDTLAAGASKTAFFFLQASGETLTPQSHTVNVYEGGLSGTLEGTAGFTFTAVDETISALANKVNTVVTGPNPPGLGGIVVITVTGATGTIGNDKILAYTPAAYAYWPAADYELISTEITLSGGNTGTYRDSLYIVTANKAATDYEAVYRFRAVGVTTAPSYVSPVGYISSGNQIKHTDTGTFDSLLPIQPADNKTLILSKTASPASLSSGGRITYTMSFQNSDTITVTIDNVVDTLPTTPDSPIYVTGSSLLGGGSYDNPVIAGNVLTWTNGFDLPPGATLDLVYEVDIPNTEGTYSNSAISHIGNEQIDTTLDTSDDAPASNDLTLSLPKADLRLTKTADHSTPFPGSEVTFSLTLVNDGPENGTGIEVTDLLPSGLTFVSATPSVGTYTSGTGVWEVGSLANGATETLAIKVTVDSFSAVENIAEVTAADLGDPDSTPGNSNTGEDDYGTATVTPDTGGGGICYLVADSGDELTRVIRTTGTEVTVGLTGTANIEATAYWPGTDIIYAADADRLGTLDFAGTGTFTAIGPTFGSGDGALGSITLSDVDGLAFDPLTGILYGTHRRSGNDDLLFQINQALGTYIPDAFGVGTDYVVVNTSGTVGFPDIDDISIDPYDGQLYGIANDGGTGDRLVKIDKTTGAVTDVGALGQNDMEGLSFDAYGVFYGTTGGSNGYFTVNKTTGVATLIAALVVGTDYESVACLTDGVNQITGTVFYDADVSGTYDGGTDSGAGGVTVRLYRDVNGDGLVDGGDVLVSVTTTSGDGSYDFTVAAEGDFVLEIDTGDLPGDATLTTDNKEEATFTGFGNTDAGNDFGYTGPLADLRLTKTVDIPLPVTGTDVTFTLTLVNDGPEDGTGIDVTDLLPNGLAFVSATPSVGTYTSGTGVWEVGSLANGATATLTITATVEAFYPVSNIAEVTAADQQDSDSTPGNGDAQEDDHDQARVTPDNGAGGGICYLVADSGDELTWVVRTTGAETTVGLTGTTNIEATAYWPGTDIIYAANANRLGTLDFAGTGTFTAIGPTFGSGDGALGSITLSDVDGLAFDPLTGILYGTHRRSGNDDLLFQINQALGTYIPDAFGVGTDYVVVNTSGTVGFPDIDDISIDPYDGQLYGIANDGGTGDRLVKIDKTTGAVTDVGALGQDDMEGLSFDAYGVFYGTTGTGGGNGYFTVNKTTGVATLIAALVVGTDYESVACLTDGVNQITGTVFYDADVSGTYDGGTDSGAGGVTVRLYRDVNGDGLVDGGDVLVSVTTTSGDGGYDFTVAAEGDFVLEIDTGDLPGDATLTTDNKEEATFTGFGNTDAGNDFGYTRPVDLRLTKTVDEPAPDTDTNVTFTLTLVNDGPEDGTGIDVTDLLPDSLAFVSATPSVGTYTSSTGVWEVGSLANGATATLTITATVEAETTVLTNIAEVTAADQPDPDSTPGNASTGEDDYDTAVITPQGSSGGGDGGIESDGSLARTLARLHFERRRNTPPVPTLFRRTTSLTAAGKGAGGNVSLLDLIPETGPQGSPAHVVSPADLLPVTNADDIFAVDYLRPRDGRRLAAVFAAVTVPGTIYEHTKVVCDRLRGAALVSVKHVDVAGHPFILSELQHGDGAVDYALSFVVYPDGQGFTVDSRFRVDEYRPKQGGQDVFNLQVWSVSKTYTLALAEQVLSVLSAQGVVEYFNKAGNPPPLPQVYVRQGRYAAGRLHLDIYNAAGAGRLILTGGTLARTESGERQVFSRDVTLPSQKGPLTQVTVDVGSIFDAAFFVETDLEEGKDQLYLADGPWSYAYDPGGAFVNTFEVTEQADQPVRAGKRVVERGIHVNGEVRTWTSAFRYLQANAQPLDLRAYGYLEFRAWGRGQMRVFIEKASLADQYSAVVKLDEQARTYRLWFENLRRDGGLGGFTAEDVVSVQFFIVGEQGRTRPFEVHVEDLRIGGAEGDVLAEVPEGYELRPNYPNPFNPRTTIQFGMPEPGPIRLMVYDMLGREVAVLVDGVLEAGRHSVGFEAGGRASGVYLYRLQTPNGMLTRAMILMK